jgi:hypothetical protein
MPVNFDIAMKLINQSSNIYTPNIGDIFNINEVSYRSTHNSVKIYKKQPAFIYPTMIFLYSNKAAK